MHEGWGGKQHILNCVIHIYIHTYIHTFNQVWHFEQLRRMGLGCTAMGLPWLCTTTRLFGQVYVRMYVCMYVCTYFLN